MRNSGSNPTLGQFAPNQGMGVAAGMVRRWVRFNFSFNSVVRTIFRAKTDKCGMRTDFNKSLV
jgi:hypothetical protein